MQLILGWPACASWTASTTTQQTDFETQVGEPMVQWETILFTRNKTDISEVALWFPARPRFHKCGSWTPVRWVAKQALPPAPATVWLHTGAILEGRVPVQQLNWPEWLTRNLWRPLPGHNGSANHLIGLCKPQNDCRSLWKLLLVFRQLWPQVASRGFYRPFWGSWRPIEWVAGPARPRRGLGGSW